MTPSEPEQSDRDQRISEQIPTEHGLEAVQDRRTNLYLPLVGGVIIAGILGWLLLGPVGDDTTPRPTVEAPQPPAVYRAPATTEPSPK